jgi:hypothetical protein
MTLPDSIAGYQHIIPEEITREGDIEVKNGKPYCFAPVGHLVANVESDYGYNVYRKIPVAKQGGVDHAPSFGAAGPLVLEAAVGLPAPVIMPTDAKERKRIPIYSGFLRYFPRAVAAVAELSRIGNDQHNPGKPLHWDRSKSGDEADALMRHLMECDAVDKDGVPHAVKVAWRGMALAEKFLEKQNNK